MPKKPAPTTPPKPELTYEPEGELPRVFLVYLTNGVWRMKDGGSTQSLLSAGTFPEAKARELALSEDQVIPLERAVQEATRSCNPVVLAAIAAKVAR